MTYKWVFTAFQTSSPSMKEGPKQESEKELRMEYVRCDHMKGKRYEETVKHGIAWLVSKFCKRSGLKGRGEGQTQID